MKKNKKFYYKFKRFFLVFSILCVIFSLAFVPNVYAINDNNGGVLAYSIRIGYSSSITYSPNYSFTSYNTYNYANTNQFEFKISDGSNGFENNYYRYLNFKLDNTTAISKVVTIRYVSYYARHGSTDTYNMDGGRYAWVNGLQYSGTKFNYFRTAQNGITYQGGQFSFGLNPNTTNVNVVLCAGFNEQTANILGYLVEIDVQDYDTYQDIIDNQNANTDRIVGIFESEDYNDFEGLGDETANYNDSESQVRDEANNYLDNVKDDLFDTNLLNPNVNSPLKGFKVISLFIDKFTSLGPIGFVFKMSISFGIIAFVLGLAITIYKGVKK